MAEIIVIDDDRALRRTLELHITELGHHVSTAATAGEGEALWRDGRADLILLDLMLPDEDGLSLLNRMNVAGLGGTPVILITGHEDLETAAQAMRAGAWDYIHKPVDLDELDAALKRVLDDSGRASGLVVRIDSDTASGRGRIIGTSSQALEMHKAIGLASRGAATVLIRGESGTGKELVARAIHRLANPDQPFIAVNCSAVPSTLIESELFGHEKGAFTGAIGRKIGRLEASGRGTLFLDEIGDLAYEVQAKLLRVLQEREFERIGSHQLIPFAARVVAATHRDLEQMVKDGLFREDLYYRLKVMEIAVPPLRERMDDLPALIAYFLGRINRELRRQVTVVPNYLIEGMRRYHWPGNVRELENRLTAAVLSSTGVVLEMELPGFTGEGASDIGAGGWRRSLAEVERDHIARVLRNVGGHFGRACEVLGITRPTLRKKMEDYGLKMGDKNKIPDRDNPAEY